MLRAKKGRIPNSPFSLATRPPVDPAEDALWGSGHRYRDLDCPSSLWKEDHQRFVAYKGKWSFLDGGRSREAGNDIRYGRFYVNHMKTLALGVAADPPGAPLDPATQRHEMLRLVARGLRQAARKTQPLSHTSRPPRDGEALHADAALLGQGYGALESALHVDIGADIQKKPPADGTYRLTRRVWRMLGKTPIAPGLMGYVCSALRNAGAHPQVLTDLYGVFAQTHYVYELPIGNAWAYQVSLDRFFRHAAFYVTAGAARSQGYASDDELRLLCGLFAAYNHESGLPPNVTFSARIEALVPPNWTHVFLQILRDRQYPCDGRTFHRLAVNVSKLSPVARQDLVDYHLQQAQRWWYCAEGMNALLYLMCNRGDAEASIEVMNSERFKELLRQPHTRDHAFRMLLYRAVKFEGMRDALVVFNTMQDKGVKPDLQCYGMLIHGYKERGYHEEAISAVLEVSRHSYLPLQIASDYVEAVAKGKGLKEALAVYVRLFGPESLERLGVFSLVLRGSVRNHISQADALAELPRVPNMPGFRDLQADMASMHILYRALLEKVDSAEEVVAIYERLRDVTAELVAQDSADGVRVARRWRWIREDSGFALMAAFNNAILRTTGDIATCLYLVRDFIATAKRPQAAQASHNSAPQAMFAPEVFNTLVTTACYHGRYDYAEEALRLALSVHTPTNKVVFMPLMAHINGRRMAKAEVFWNIAVQSNDVFSYLDYTAQVLPVADEHGWKVPAAVRQAVESYLEREEIKGSKRVVDGDDDGFDADYDETDDSQYLTPADAELVAQVGYGVGSRTGTRAGVVPGRKMEVQKS